MAFTLLLFTVLMQICLSQHLTSYRSKFASSIQESEGAELGLLGVRYLDPPPVISYQPPSSGFLRSQEVAQGLQQPGRLVLENPLSSLSKLKNGEFTHQLERSREALASELTPSIAQVFKPFLSRRLGYADGDEGERTDGVSTKDNHSKGHVFQKVRAKKEVDKEDQLSLEASVANTEESYPSSSADIINSEIPIKPNTADEVTNFRLLDRNDDNKTPLGLVTTPFAEPAELRNGPLVTANAITSNPLIPKETVYSTFDPEPESKYTLSAKVNSPVFNRQPITSSLGQKPPVYLPTEAKFAHNVDPTSYPVKEIEDGFIKSSNLDSNIYPSHSSDSGFTNLKNLKSGTYPEVLSAQDQIAVSHQSSDPAENKYTALTSFPSTETNDIPTPLNSGDDAFTGHSPPSVENKSLTSSFSVTQGAFIQPTTPAAPSVDISKDQLLTGPSHLSNENKLVLYTSTIRQETPAQPTAVPVTSPTTPVGLPNSPSFQGVSSAVPFVPNSVLQGVTSHLRPIHISTPLVTPFNPYTTLFQPPLGFSDGLKNSYNIPLFNLGLGGNSYFK